MAQSSPRLIPIDVYFNHEDVAQYKSEYHGGSIVAMAGASPAHVRITPNLTRLIGNQLESRHCEPFDSDMRVIVPACNAVYYPDLAVACEPPVFADVRLAALLNPAFIVEVLSPITDRADRGIKFDCYRTLDTLVTYVLVSQDEARLEIYTRQVDGAWRYDSVTGMHASLTLEAINCELRLANIYARVEFPLRPSASDCPSARS